MVEHCQMMLQHVCLGMLGVLALVSLALFVSAQLGRLSSCLRRTGRLNSALALLAVGAMVVYGGTKPEPGPGPGPGPDPDPEPGPEPAPVVSVYRLTVKSKNASYGSVSGGGRYKSGEKATIKATAKTGKVFAGWFKDKSCKTKLNPKGYDNRKPAVKVVMPGKNMTVYAKFVTKAADKKALKFSAATKKLAKTPVKVKAGAAFSKTLGFSSASFPTVTAKGLPKGLAIDKRTAKISGKAKKKGSSTAKVTVKSAAGNKISQNVKFKVVAP